VRERLSRPARDHPRTFHRCVSVGYVLTVPNGGARDTPAGGSATDYTAPTNPSVASRFSNSCPFASTRANLQAPLNLLAKFGPLAHVTSSFSPRARYFCARGRSGAQADLLAILFHLE
jgi:hypothetical protein